MKKLLLTAILLTSCNVQGLNINQNDYVEPTNIEEKTSLSFSTLDLKPYEKEKSEKDKKTPIKTWFNYILKKSEDIKIDKVVLADTGAVIDDTGTESIKPDYAGKEVIISIKGKFADDIIKKDNMFFQNEPNLLQMSYVGEKAPKTKVLLDDAILLEYVSATKTEIKVKVKTQAIPDFYLKGLHKLSVLSENNEHRTDTLVRIGDPVAPLTSLSPSIDEVKIIKVKDVYYDKDSKEWAFKVLKEDEEMKPEELEKQLRLLSGVEISRSNDTAINLKIKGRNFMMFYKFSFSKIDGLFGFCHSTAISKDTNGNTVWESIIHIPDIKAFNKLTSHSISYSTPFGTAIRRF